MSEIKLVKRIKYAGDVHAALMELGWDAKTAAAFLDDIPDADAEKVFEQIGLVKEAFEMAKSNLAPGPKWISVKDKLPETESRYLCVKRIGKSGMVYVQIMNGDSYGFSMDHFYTDDVTHWMPLPEPPKEG